MIGGYIIRGLAFFVIGLFCTLGAIAQEQSTFDGLFSELHKVLGVVPKEAERLLERLKVLQPTFTAEQNENTNWHTRHPWAIKENTMNASDS